MSIFLSPKNGYFPKGFTHGFGQKVDNFFSVFFSKIGLEIMISYGLERKEGFEDDKNLNFFEVQKMGIFQRVHPWFRSKS